MYTCIRASNGQLVFFPALILVKTNKFIFIHFEITAKKNATTITITIKMYLTKIKSHEWSTYREHHDYIYAYDYVYMLWFIRLCFILYVRRRRRFRFLLR